MPYKKPDIAKDLQIIEIDLRTLQSSEQGQAAFEPVHSRVCALMAAMGIERAAGLWQIGSNFFREQPWRSRGCMTTEEVEALRQGPDAKLTKCAANPCLQAGEG